MLPWRHRMASEVNVAFTRVWGQCRIHIHLSWRYPARFTLGIRLWIPSRTSLIRCLLHLFLLCLLHVMPAALAFALSLSAPPSILYLYYSFYRVLSHLLLSSTLSFIATSLWRKSEQGKKRRREQVKKGGVLGLIGALLQGYRVDSCLAWLEN